MNRLNQALALIYSAYFCINVGCADKSSAQASQPPPVSDESLVAKGQWRILTKQVETTYAARVFILRSSKSVRFEFETSSNGTCTRFVEERPIEKVQMVPRYPNRQQAVLVANTGASSAACATSEIARGQLLNDDFFDQAFNVLGDTNANLLSYGGYDGRYRLYYPDSVSVGSNSVWLRPLSFTSAVFPIINVDNRRIFGVTIDSEYLAPGTQGSSTAGVVTTAIEFSSIPVVDKLLLTDYDNLASARRATLYCLGREYLDSLAKQNKPRPSDPWEIFHTMMELNSESPEKSACSWSKYWK